MSHVHLHPLTGLPLSPLGVLPNGRVVWPILGGDDSVPPATEPPEGVSKEEWDALGDPGKRALIRERTARQEAERKVAAAHARPTPPPGTKPALTTPEQPDLAKMIADAVAAATKPLIEAEERRTQQEQGAVVEKVIRDAATGFHDPSDAVANIDRTKILVDGVVDTDKLAAELATLGTSKPHLIRDPRRFAPAGAGGQQGDPAKTADAKAAEIGQQMSTALGFKVGA
jgi:hypothetical protein